MDLRTVAQSENSQSGGKTALTEQASTSFPSVRNKSNVSVVRVQERCLAITLYAIIRESLLRFVRILDEGNAVDVEQQHRFSVRALFASMASKTMDYFRGWGFGGSQ